MGKWWEKNKKQHVGTCSNQQSKKEANSGALMPSHGRSGHGDWAWGCTTRRVLRSWKMAWPPIQVRNSKPATTDESTQETGHIGTTDAEGSSCNDRKRNAEFSASMSTQHHGDEHNHISKQHCENPLPPCHTHLHQAPCQVVRRHSHHKSHSQAPHVARRQNPSCFHRRCAILVIQPLFWTPWISGRNGFQQLCPQPIGCCCCWYPS
jgi:hypothetical protein